ncbi:MAG: hypothetical protein SFY32_07105 [Bacteroidota bacterium]|nr:hypothetical protein [Bacteroidota bacterium]
MDKEIKDRISDYHKEELKSRYEYLRIAIFFLATIGSGVLSFAFKESMTNTEFIGAIIGFIFVILDFIYIASLIKQIRNHLNALKMLL